MLFIDLTDEIVYRLITCYIDTLSHTLISIIWETINTRFTIPNYRHE